MTDPERLLDEGATSLELELLRAGDAEEPSAHAQRATLVALGLGTAAFTTSGNAAAGAAATGAKFALGKWWAAAAVAAAAAGTASYGLLSASSPSSDPPALPAPAKLARPPVPPSSAQVEEAAPAASLPELAPAPTTRAASSAPRGPAVSSSATLLQEEIALVDRARQAAAAGKPAATLAALDEHAKRFPTGALQQETLMLRIEALLARGDRATATRLGRRFLDNHPRSALAPRVRQLLGE